MDIDDILAEVTADAVPQETRDLQELTRAWVSERVAPEILPYPEGLMERVLERIRRQVRTTQIIFLGKEDYISLLILLLLVCLGLGMESGGWMRMFLRIFGEHCC